MSTGKSESRIPPKYVEPVVIGDIRYEQVMNATIYGFKAAQGYLRAVRVASDEELWIKQVYAIDIDQGLEGDVQEVYFYSMTVGSDGNILIGNEQGKFFSVSPDTGKSTLLDKWSGEGK